MSKNRLDISVQNYQGRLLNCDYTVELQERVAQLVETLQSLEAINAPVIPYLAAWGKEKKGIWYEFIGQELCDMLGCTPETAARSFRAAVIDRRVYRNRSQDDQVEEEIITQAELGGQRRGIREEVSRSGVEEAVYKIAVNETTVWLKDQARIENFGQDHICLSMGILTDVTKEMEQKDLIEKIGYFDELTGLPKRLIMERIFEINIGHFCRSQIDDFVFMMIDIDHFKSVNDTFGHQAGDYVLSEMAELMTVTKRKEDEIGRYGGEEFYGFSLGSIEHGLQFAERLRGNIAEHRFIFEERVIPVTVSIGLAAASQFSGASELTAAILIKNADQMLYAAKQRGRNKVVLYGNS